MSTSPTPGAREPAAGDRLQLAASLLAVLALAAWMDLSRAQLLHDADSLLPVLMSTQHWTFFYWGQNRFGSLLPLLASPLRHPYHNLLAQVGLRFAAVGSAFLLLARLVVRRPYWPAIGLSAWALALLALPLELQAHLAAQPYPLALALSLGSAELVRSPRRPAIALGLALLLLAFWLTPTTLFWLMPLEVTRSALLAPDARPIEGRLAEPGAAPWRRLRRALPFVAPPAAFVASVLTSRFWPGSHGTDLGIAPAASWPHGWVALATNVARLLGPAAWAAVGTVMAAGLVPAAGRGAGGLAARVCGCLLATAAVEGLVLGTSAWVRDNLYPLRYQCAGLFCLVLVVPAVLSIALLEGRPRAVRRAALAVALAALVAVVGWRFGPPSPARARAAFDGAYGRFTPALLAAGCTHLIGNYWVVWPAVLHANNALFEAGSTRQLWGITVRSEATAALWRPELGDRARIALLGSSSEIEQARRENGVPQLRPVGVAGTLTIAGLGEVSDPGPPPLR